MGTDDDFTGPVNLGNPHEFSILELAKKVIALTNSQSKLVHRPLPSDDPTQRQPDISLAGHVLSWKPEKPLDEGLINTIAYFSDVLSEKR